MMGITRANNGTTAEVGGAGVAKPVADGRSMIRGRRDIYATRLTIAIIATVEVQVSRPAAL